MAKFRTGGSGPDGRGLGWIAGITKHRFERAGEIYETNDPDEIEALRRCSHVEEIVDKITPHRAEQDDLFEEPKQACSREELEHQKMKELIRIGHGLYRVGMTKVELIDKMVADNEKRK
jgi:hypothetical protein